MAKKSLAGFGVSTEWKNFTESNRLFFEKFPNLQEALNIAFLRKLDSSEPIDRVVFVSGRRERTVSSIFSAVKVEQLWRSAGEPIVSDAVTNLGPFARNDQDHERTAHPGETLGPLYRAAGIVFGTRYARTAKGPFSPQGRRTG